MQHVTTWGERDATTRFQGFVTAADFLRCAFELTGHPSFDTQAFFVADFSDITGHDIDTATVREDLAAQALGARPSNSRYQIVVVTRDAGIADFTAKMRAIYGEDGPRIFLFGTREEAERWMADQDPPPIFRSSTF